MAAVLACGNAAVGETETTVLGRWAAAISYRTAASLWGLLSMADGPIDISIPGQGGRHMRKGIRLHRSISLSPAMVTLHDAIPITTPSRTISDLRRAVNDPRSGVSARDLRRAIRQAEVLGLPVGPETIADRTRSELEYLFLQLCRRQRLPMPEVNVRIAGMIVDFLWRDARLIVETDGYRYHRGREAFEADRDRDLRLRAIGYEVIRLSHRQVVDDRRAVAATLRKLLGASIAR
ncbi:MAG TPA: DUF559 domain-containing protein [Solirubrobacterales bacterium]|nr:DUF559 domain-containing protein [Solirubrobacterales bacterium]